MSSQGIRIEKPQTDEPSRLLSSVQGGAAGEPKIFWLFLTASFLFSGVSFALAAIIYLNK